jgi:hypothetical protein
MKIKNTSRIFHLNEFLYQQSFLNAERQKNINFKNPYLQRGVQNNI